MTELRRQLEEVELKEALAKRTATMHGIQSKDTSRNVQLGPIPTADVELEGSQTKALLDTGSPVTIVSYNSSWKRLPNSDPTAKVQMTGEQQ